VELQYNGVWHGLKYCLSIAHGFRVDRFNVAITMPRDRATQTIARLMSNFTAVSVPDDDHGPSPYRRVRSSATTRRSDAMAAASWIVAVSSLMDRMNRQDLIVALGPARRRWRLPTKIAR